MSRPQHGGDVYIVAGCGYKHPDWECDVKGFKGYEALNQSYYKADITKDFEGYYRVAELYWRIHDGCNR